MSRLEMSSRELFEKVESGGPAFQREVAIRAAKAVLDAAYFARQEAHAATDDLVKLISLVSKDEG